MNDLQNSIQIQFHKVPWLMNKCTVSDGSGKLAICKAGEMITIDSPVPIDAKITVQGCFGKLKHSLSPGIKYYINASKGAVTLERTESLAGDSITKYTATQLQENTPTFKPTKKIFQVMEIDEQNHLVKFPSGIFGGTRKSTAYRYSDILEYELLEDGFSVTKGGLGRALVFGAVTSGIGAIVGAVTAPKTTRSVCESLKIKVTVNDINNPAVFINFITSKTKTNSIEYKERYKTAQETLSLLNVICTSVNS